MSDLVSIRRASSYEAVGCGDNVSSYEGSATPACAFHGSRLRRGGISPERNAKAARTSEIKRDCNELHEHSVAAGVASRRHTFDHHDNVAAVALRANVSGGTHLDSVGSIAIEVVAGNADSSHSRHSRDRRSSARHNPSAPAVSNVDLRDLLELHDCGESVAWPSGWTATRA